MPQRSTLEYKRCRCLQRLPRGARQYHCEILVWPCVAFILFSGSGYIRCAVSISHQASEFLSMEIIYESDSIKIIFPLESTPYINIVHVHMLVSVHLLKSRKRWYLLSFCKSDVISQKHCYRPLCTATFECRALIGSSATRYFQPRL